MQKISILVTAYLPDSKPYLDVLVESISMLNYPKDKLETVIVAPKSYAPQYPDVKTVSPPESTYHMPRGLNYGMSQLASDAELFFVMNDDVILTPNSVVKLSTYFQLFPQLGLLMPMGNDQQGAYFLGLPMFRPGRYKIEDVQGIKDEIMSASSIYPPGLIWKDALCLYAVMHRRSLVDKIGLYDEDLISGDDSDYSWRSRQNGFINAIALDSLVWHAGGVSADKTFTPEMRAMGQQILNKKWGPDAIG